MDKELVGVWEEFRIPLRRMIQTRVGKAQDVEDILQTVFLKVLDNLGGLKDGSKLKTWVYTITNHAIADFYKAQRHELPLDQLPEEVLLVEQEDETVGFELANCIKSLVQQLPEKYREAIILTEYEHLTQKELAQRLGLSVSGAKSRVQRARVHLKELLLHCCLIEQDHQGMIIYYERKQNNCYHC